MEIFENNCPPIVSGEEIIFEVFKANGASVAYVRIPSGSKSVPHYHKEMTEIYTLLEGAGFVNINDKSIEVNVGDSIRIDPNEVHNVEATLNMRFMCIASPAWTIEDHIIA